MAGSQLRAWDEAVNALDDFDPSDRLEAAILDMGETVEDDARRRLKRHHRSGMTDKSLRTTVKSHTVLVNVEGYARFIAGGTPRHIIKSHGRPLAFDSPRRFAATVHHPGTSADPFFSKAIDASEGDFDAIASRAGQAIVDDLADDMEG